MSPSSRSIDIAVLGATGFTGQRVLEYLLNLQHANSLSIAAAGRDKRKLLKLIQDIDAGDKVEIVTVDARNAGQVHELAQSTRLLLNCVGPYRYTGEAIVAACVQAGADYMDVTGEPEFMESVEFKFKEQASANGCFVTSAVGFDSVPADLGTIYMQQKLSQVGTPATVESFLSLHTTAKSIRANYATWESAVEGVGSVEQLQQLRKEIRRSGKSLPAPKTVGPKLNPPAGASYDKRVQAYVIPFPGSDASVVRRTQKIVASLNGQAVQYAASFSVQSLYTLLLLFFFSALLRLLAAWALGRKLLLSFPGLFSFGVFTRQGPSQHHLDSTSFTMHFIGKAFSSGALTSNALPDKELRMKIVGPDPGYVATPIFLVQAALTFLEERNDIVGKLGDGGVFTPGALLGGSSYVSRLQKAGIKFQDE